VPNAERTECVLCAAGTTTNAQGTECVHTNAPTAEVTNAPTNAPTVEVTNAPTNAPTAEVTNAPTVEVTNAPTNAPTVEVTNDPTFRELDDLSDSCEAAGLHSITTHAGCEAAVNALVPEADEVRGNDNEGKANANCRVLRMSNGAYLPDGAQLLVDDGKCGYSSWGIHFSCLCTVASPPADD
jgi:hypothetical protein